MHGHGLAGVIIFQLPIPSVKLPCHGRLLGKELEPGQWQRIAIAILYCYKSSTYKVNNTRTTRHPTCCPAASYRRGKDIVLCLCQQSEDSLGLTRRPSANNTSSPKSGKDILGGVNIFRTTPKTRGACFCK